MSDLDPLSFAALAASGPLWNSQATKPSVLLKQNQRRCAHCQRIKNLDKFSTGATVCQRCVAENKLRRSKEAKARYAAKKRQALRDKLREQNRVQEPEDLV